MPNEKRIALILNGGVSLAVWMSGAVSEVNSIRLVSASHDADTDGLSPALTTSSRAAWRAILQACGSPRVVVDIVGGTSAGGLNGAILAQNIASGTDLPSLKAMWASMASLTTDTLLNNPPSESRWALNSDFLETQIASVMDNEIPGLPLVAPARVSLLVTATAVNTRATPYSDDAHSMYYVRDSRRVYQFRNNPNSGGVSDFDNRADLTRAARASASFPVAFQPVEESVGLANRRLSQEPEGVDEPGAALPGQLMDGGLLDNAPLEWVIDEILKAPVSGPWKRYLLYITPSINAGAPTDDASELTWFNQLAGLLQIIQEPDERLDRDALRRAKRSAGVTPTGPATILGRWLATPDGGQLNLDGNIFNIDDLKPEISNRTFSLYRFTRLRYIQVSSESEGFSPWVDNAIPTDTENEDGVMRAGLPNWHWGIPVAEQLGTWWGRILNSVPDGVNLTASAFEAVGALQEFTRGVIADLYQGGLVADEQAAIAFYGGPGVVELDGLISSAATGVGEVFGRSREDVLDLSLRMEVIASTMTWGHEMQEWPDITFSRLTPREVPIFSNDEFLGEDWISKKLYGERWGHFGAFATTPGREHDWLWGRLDAAAHLSNTLLADSGVDEEVANILRRNLAHAILQEEMIGLTSESERLDALAADAEAMVELDASKLFACMEEENAGTFDDLIDVAYALTADLSIPPKFRDLLGIAVGVSTTSVAPTERFSWCMRKVVKWKTRGLRKSVRTRLGI